MKNKIIIFLFCIFFFLPSFAENLNIQALGITIDKKTKITIFKDQVSAKDDKNNELLTELAEYNKDRQLFKTFGKTTVITSGGFVIEGNDIIFDNNKNYIKSSKPAKVRDLEKNEIYLDNFEYSTSESFFQSSGNIKVIDSKDNQYNFSQIYIDEKKRNDVFSIPGITKYFFWQGKPATVKADEISNMRNYIDGLYSEKSIFSMCEGEFYKIPEGPFLGQKGKVIELKNSTKSLPSLSLY
mgnify:CR=1 FL=1